MENTIKFIEETLKLRVKRNKSGVFRPRRAKFLGCTLAGAAGVPRVHPKRFKLKLCEILPRGWRRYFKLDSSKGVFEELDEHIRRLRKLLRIAWKRPKTR